jgi:hypothetical protein
LACRRYFSHWAHVAFLRLPAASKAGVVEELRRLWPVKGAGCSIKTDEQQRGRADCLHGPDVPPAAVVVQVRTSDLRT